MMLVSVAVGAIHGAESPTNESATTPAPIQTITLDQALDIALANNLALAADSYGRLVARENSTIARAAYDPVFSVSAQRNVRQAEQDVTNPLDGSLTERFVTGAEVSQAIDTGGEIALSTGGSRIFQNRQGTVINPEYGADVTLSISQPLLSGAGFAVSRAQRRRAVLEITRTDLNFRAQILNVVRDVELAFFDLASAHDQYAVRQSAVTAAERLVSENEARQRAGLATELDVMTSRVGLANSQAQLIQAEQTLQSASDNLLALLGYRNLEGLLQPMAVDYTIPPPVSVGTAFGRARENDPQLLAAQTQLMQLEIDTRVARNERLPQLNFNGSLAYNGTDASYNDALDKVPEGNAYNWQAGLTLNVPWGLKAGRARARIASYNVEQQQAFIAELEQSLLVSIRAAVRAIDTSIRSVEIAELATQLSTREYELERARFDSGLSTSRLVVEAQQRGDEQQVAETQARVQLKQNEAQLRRLEGTSLDRYELEVPTVE